MPPDLDDHDDRIIELLEVIAANTQGGSGERSSVSIQEGDVERTVNVTQPDDENTGNYFSTGSSRLLVENESSWEDINFGFLAEVINIRTTHDIEVAFANPNQQSQPMTIRAGESPFTIGGAYGIGTAFIWVRRADSATDVPGIEIVAYR